MIRVIEEMSRAEAAASRREGLRTSRCLLKEDGGRYWRQRGCGYTTDLTLAGEYDVQYAIDHLSNNDRILIIEEVPDDPTKPKILRDIGVVVGFSIKALLEASPQNQTILAMVMAKVGRMPPAELTTYEQIKDWIELTPDLMPGGKRVVTVPTGTPAPPPAAAITVPITLTQKVYGRCRYSADSEASSTVSFSEAEIREWLEQDMDLVEIMEVMREKVSNEAWEHEADGSAQEDNYEYEEYEITDSSDSDHDYDENHMQNQLNELLRRIATDEQRTRLGL